MRRKKLLTAALCTVTALAAGTVSSRFDYTNMTIETVNTVLAAESEEQSGENGQKEAKPVAPASEAPTEAPTEPPTEAPTEPPTEPPTEAPTEPPTEAPTEAPTEPPTETQPPETKPAETDGNSESENQQTETQQSETPGETSPEPGTEPESSSEQGTEKETEKETEKKKEKETKKETEKESERSGYGSNAALIAHQNIVVPPDISIEFRFTQVEKRYAVVSSREGASVYESKSEEARCVGELEYYGICYILADDGDGWYYIESGNVRGFIKSEDTVTDGVADRIVKIKGMDELPSARLLVARTENEAYSYTHTTVQNVIAEKKYAVASGNTQIHEQKKDDSRVTGEMSDGDLCYILADDGEEWVFAESGNARGFVRRSSLKTGQTAAAVVSAKGENNMSLADVLIEPKDNKACYYTLTSVKAASQSALTRQAIVNFALRFVGNPYVWGGTSLTNGADCSGFVQSVYANFGYSLPRVAEAQAGYGMQIPISSAEPGDLIFYARNGYVYHVSMYIGNGQVVQAANSRVGIITSGIAGDAVWATRIISD